MKNANKINKITSTLLILSIGFNIGAYSNSLTALGGGNLTSKGSITYTNPTTGEEDLIFNTSDLYILKSDIDANTAGIERNTSNIDSNSSSIQNNTNAINELRSDLQSHTEENSANTNLINNLSVSVTDNTLKINTNKSDIITISNKASANETSIANLETKTSNNEANIASLGESISDIELSNTGLVDKVNTNTSNIAKNTSAIENNTTVIENNSLAIDENAVEISKNKSNISANTSKISLNTTTINNLSGRIDSVSSLVDGNSGEITSLTNSITKNTSDISDNTNNIETMQDELSKLDATFGERKTTTCQLTGADIDGELVYTTNKVSYVIMGDILFYEVDIVVKEVVTHPEGEVHVEFSVPELIGTTKASSSASAIKIGYTNGGYKRGVRRITHGNVVGAKDGNMVIALRLLRNTDSEDGFFTPNLVAANFKTDSSVITNAGNGVNLVGADSSENAKIHFSGTYIINR